jgi:hypothetical protein
LRPGPARAQLHLRSQSAVSGPVLRRASCREASRAWEERGAAARGEKGERRWGARERGLCSHFQKMGFKLYEVRHSERSLVQLHSRDPPPRASRRRCSALPHSTAGAVATGHECVWTQTPSRHSLFLSLSRQVGGWVWRHGTQGDAQGCVHSCPCADVYSEPVHGAATSELGDAMAMSSGAIPPA